MGVKEQAPPFTTVKLAVGDALIVIVCDTESLHAGSTNNLTSQTMYVPEAA